jgi:hypothetical protein
VRHIAHGKNPPGAEGLGERKKESNMHGHVMSWWRARHEGDSGSGSGCGGWSCGPGESRHGGGGRHGHGYGGGGGADDEADGFGGGPFGVRRPLRFLAYKLELDEKQVAELARVLDDLKTERAQGEVDRRRSLSGFADAVAGPTFDEKRAKESAALRVATAERLRDAVTAALGRLHALLDNDQRERLAYLIRTGVLSL